MLGGRGLHRVFGGPEWLRNDGFDIQAKAERELAFTDRLPAIMAVLAERFQLKSHQETREIPVIVLRTPKTPGGVKRSNSEEGFSLQMDRGDVVFTAVLMSRVTNYLSQMWKVPVLDETGLKGTFNFTLTTSRVEQQPGMSWGDRVREAVEDLGSRVENRRMPLEVTVVDRCERPGEN